MGGTQPRGPQPRGRGGITQPGTGRTETQGHCLPRAWAEVSSCRYRASATAPVVLHRRVLAELGQEYRCLNERWGNRRLARTCPCAGWKGLCEGSAWAAAPSPILRSPDGRGVGHAAPASPWM